MKNITTNTTINVLAIKRIALIANKAVRGFVRASARLIELTALQEQFNLERVAGFTSYSMVELDPEELHHDIRTALSIAYGQLLRLNRIAATKGLSVPYPGEHGEKPCADDFVAITSYVEDLIAASEYESYLRSLENEAEAS